MSEKSFEERYQNNDIPWDRDHADYNLINIVEDIPLEPCKVLDLGCGTGINSVWLAKHEFEVTGLDLSPTAIEKAQARATEENLDIHFLAADFLQVDLPTGFDLVFDRGCFHCFDTDADKTECAKRIAELLNEEGLWLSIIGNADDKPREVGPPTLSASDVARIVEPHFEILSLTAGYFGGEQPDPPKAWVVGMRKRS